MKRKLKYLLILFCIGILAGCSGSGKMVTYNISSIGYDKICEGTKDVIIAVKDKKYGCINNKDEVLIDFEYDNAQKSAYSDYIILYKYKAGIGAIEGGINVEKSVVVDNSGNIVAQEEGYIYSCSEGIMQIRDKYLSSNYYDTTLKSIDGTFTKEFKQNLGISRIGDFSNGKATLFYWSIQKLKDYAMVDIEGNLIETPKVNNHNLVFMSQICNDKVVAYEYDGKKIYNMYLYNIKSQKPEKINFEMPKGGFYAQSTRPSDKFFAITLNSAYKTRYSIIDLNKRKEVLSAKEGYQNVKYTDYDKGLMVAQKSNGTWGYLNTKFNEKKWYNKATGFDENKHAIVSENGTEGYIVDNKLNKVSETFETSDSVYIANNVFAVCKNNKYYLLTIN